MLQVDFLEAGSADCPLIRIAGGDVSTYRLLHARIVELAAGKTDAVAIEQIAGISSSDGTRLTAVRFGFNQGVARGDTNRTFEWRLTEGTWDNVAGLLEPFCQPRQRDGFQRIESAGDIRVVVTTNGQW
ncbi:MAG: hypothetical protein HY290_30925 [Planctomycetia bacterium]|nr:hypothetical protein [Planctomycetia bacterium]